MSRDGVSAELEDRFARAGARAWLHVIALDAPGEIGLGADEPVTLASVVKILICVAFARQVAAGALDPREPVEVPAELRVGGTGTTACLDPVRMSLRDLAVSMMTVSDNAATDVILDRTGHDAVEAVIAELGLEHTHLRGGMQWGHLRVVASLGLTGPRDLDAQLEHADPEAVRALAWLDPEHSNTATPREITQLLSAVWSDRAGPPEACRFVREAMAQQVSTQRLAAGFDLPGAHVAAKSGTLPTVRNEAGVITLGDGARYAAAVFARTESIASVAPALDTAIGAAARTAVEHLRAGD